jgi:AraC-like DNA-binding protein
MKGCLSFHVVTDGHCWLELRDHGRRLLAPGDLVLVPHGQGHRLMSDRQVKARRIDEVAVERVSDLYGVLRHGSGRTPTTGLICGAVRFEYPAAQPLVELLPRIIHIEAARALETDWIESAIRMLVVEARQLRPGGEAVITRLADIVVINAIRAWVESDEAAKVGWLGALRDRQIGAAIVHVHRNPSHEWTVASLAREAGMSRSAFAARFTLLVGESAMHYVSRWRMYTAFSWLKGDRTAVSEVASRLGYRSEAAFSRAFKRLMGVSPGSVRHL